MIATELNLKGNKIFKLGSICKMNGFDIGKNIHTAAGDVKGTINLFSLLKKKNPKFFEKVTKKNVFEFRMLNGLNFRIDLE